MMRKSIGPHWIKHSHLFETDEYECSQCGAIFRCKSHKCPICGVPLFKILDNQEWIDEAEEIHIILDE